MFNVGLALLGARTLGPTAWGGYWGAFSLAHLLSQATDLGGHLTLARRVARAPRRGGRWLGVSARVKAGLTVAVGAGWLLLRPGGGPTAGYLLLALLALSWIEWFGCYLRGFSRVVDESRWLAVDCLAAFVGGGVALTIRQGPEWLALSQVAAHGLVLTAFHGYIRRTAPRPPPAGGPPGESFLLESLPTGLAITVSLVSWRLGMLWLIRTAPAAAAGHYAAAHRLLEAARFVPAAAAVALFPEFARRASRVSPGRALAIIVPMAALPLVAALTPGLLPHVLSLALGPHYGAAAPLLLSFALALPLIAVNGILTSWLVARGRTGVNAALSGVHLTVHAVALAAWIPANGAPGAAWALAAAEGAMALGTVACWIGFK